MVMVMGVWATAAFGALPPPNVVVPESPPGATLPSRFGRLTSRRWAVGATYQRQNLAPVANPHPSPEPQPVRDHPFDIALLPDGSRAYVTLSGSEAHPGSEVAVYDVARAAIVKRILLKPANEPGPPASGPYRVTAHPGGRFLVVTHRFSNFASVIDSRTDTVVSEVPLDFYCQGLTFSADGKVAYVANRYLDQVLVVDFEQQGEVLTGRLRELGGLDEASFTRSVHPTLVSSCGAVACHGGAARGGFSAGSDVHESFLSTLRHVVPGRSKDSRLLRTVTRTRDGGLADRVPPWQGHAFGTVVFPEPARDEGYRRIAAWIDATRDGPGIPVGNPRSKPKIVTLSPDGKWLFVGNTGTQDISIVSTARLEEVGGIYLQNVVNDLKVFHAANGEDYLLATTLGVGFGVARERDPWGSETWDRTNPAAHFSVHRDLATGKVLPREQQDVLGPLDAVDGTSAIKFRDLQNDLVVVKLSALQFPEKAPAQLKYLLKANRYESHDAWVRYTSDTAESTWGDVKGDIPPDLMRVVGAFPEKLILDGDRVLVSMQSSESVQELRIDPSAADPSDRLVPTASWTVGLQPIGIAATPELLLTANFLSGTLSVVHRATGKVDRVLVDPSMVARPFPLTNAERGELTVHTAIFSSDGDTSCFHCHYFDTGDGRPWGVSQVVGQEYSSASAATGDLVIGGTMGVPQMRNLFTTQPFFLEGTLSAFEPRSMLMEHAPADDFAGPTPQGDFTSLEGHVQWPGLGDLQSSMQTGAPFESTLEERRDAMFRAQSQRVFGKAFTLRDFQRFVGEWQIHEVRLLPNPFDATSRPVLRGKMLFEDPQVGCISCHAGENFTRKDFPESQALPPLVMLTPRDAAFTLISMNRLDAINGIKRDLEPWDVGRSERIQGQFTTFPLRGLWDRPPVFLHSGMARSLREVVCTPGHTALRRYPYGPLLGGVAERPGQSEVGFNETMVVPEFVPRVKPLFDANGRIGVDTHGGTSQLRPHEVDDLVDYLEAIP